MAGSIYKDPWRRLRLGLLPVKGDHTRTANIITKNDHIIWTLENKQQVKAFLQESFPQLDIDLFVSPDEIERFSKSKGGQFPQPQYANRFLGVHLMIPVHCTPRLGLTSSSPRPPHPPLHLSNDTCSMQLTLGGANSMSRGVLLIGDSLHAFPPDLGQGVNSGLEDVFELNNALDQSQYHSAPPYPLSRVSHICRA